MADKTGIEKSRAFEKLSALVYAESGISLDSTKESLVATRTRKRMSHLGIKELGEYFEHIINEDTGMELIIFIDSISTNVTYFYREDEHFKILDSIIRGMAGAGQERFRIWSAGCSSGEEVYTMAFTCLEALAGTDAELRILGTDISTRILGKAHQAMYEKKGVERVPEALKLKYFDRLNCDGADFYRVKHSIKEYVMLKQLNLSVTPYPVKAGVDVIFCRNVMIYFDREMRKRIVDEYCRLLKPGGFLFVSQTESLLDIEINLKNIGNSVYRKD